MNKLKVLRWGALSLALTLPLTTVISCNINLKKNIKYNQLDNDLLFESNEGKQLQEIIQKQFSQTFLEWTFLDDFYNPKNREWNESENQFIQKEPSILASSTTPEDIISNMIDFYGGYGNMAADIYSQIEWSIWKNKSISRDVHALLNQIRTTYNRTKQIYPLETKIIEKNGLKWGKITFQVDFLSSLNKRFMGHYLELTGLVPLTKASDKILAEQIIDFATQKTNFITDNELLKIFYTDPGRTYGLPPNFISSSNYLNQTISDFSTLNFNLNATKDHYVLEYQKTNDATINSSTGALDATWTTAYIKDESNQIKEFSKDTKLKEIAIYLEKQMFINNENAYIAQMFNGQDKWIPDVQIVAKSGTSIEEITLDDYLNNFIASTQAINDLPFVNDYAHFNIYMTNETHKDWNWLQTNNPLSSKLTSEEVIK